MAGSDGARQIRRRQAAGRFDADRVPEPIGSGQPIILVRPTDHGSYPAVAQNVYACNVLDMDAVEEEGGAVTFTVQTGSLIFVANLGTAVPTPDTDGLAIVALSVNGRYVMVYNG